MLLEIHLCFLYKSLDFIKHYLSRLLEDFEKEHAKGMTTEELLRVSDYVTIHVPLTEETKDLISGDMFDLFRKDAVLAPVSLVGHNDNIVVRCNRLSIPLVEFLDQRKDKAGVALQLADQNVIVVRFLDCVLFLLVAQSRSGEVAVFIERLRAQFFAVHHKHHFIGIPGGRDKLRRFKRGHGLAGTGSMPDIAAQLTALFPAVLGQVS